MRPHRERRVAAVVAIAAVVAAIVAALLWDRRDTAPSAPTPGSAASQSLAVGGEVPDRVRETGTRPITPGAFVESRGAVDGAESRGPIDRDYDLHGRVIDSAGVPVAGASVAAVRNESRDFGSVLDLDYARAVRQIASTTTDDAGAFRVRLERGRAVDLVVTAEAHPKTTVRNRYAGEFVEVRLQKAATLVGTVTQASDQAPVADVGIRAFRMGEPGGLFQGVTDASGRFEFAGLEPGRIVLELAPPAHRAPPWCQLTLSAGETQRSDFSLEAGPMVTGVVTDAATGLPIAGAEVGEDWTFFRPVMTGADGRWVLRGVSKSRDEIHARAKGYGRKNVLLPDDIPEKLELAIVLERGRSVRGRIVTADRVPVAGAYVAAVSSTSVAGHQEIDWPATRTGPEGRFEIGEMRRDIPHAVYVRKEGLASSTFDLPPNEKESEILDLGDLMIDEPATISGVVVDPNDHPLADVALRLKGDNADRFKLWRDENRRNSAAGSYLGSYGARTDDLGRFRFTDVAAGDYSIKRAEPTRDDDRAVLVSVRRGATVEGIRVVLNVPITIAGRVRRQGGGRLPLCVVEAYLEGSENRENRTNRADGGLTKGDGEFELTRIKEGGVYTLVVKAFRQQGDGVPESLAPATVTGVRSGTRDVRVVLVPASTITGTVLDHSGKPVKDAFVFATDLASRLELGSARSGEDGSFKLDAPDGATFKVEAMTPVYENGRVSSWTRPTAEADSVRAGTKDLILTIPAPR